MTTKKRYNEMSFGELLVAGATEAADIARGKKKPAKIVRVPITVREAKVAAPPTYRAPRVRAVRQRLGLSQPVFARALNVSLGTVRGWEQGARVPDGPSRRLLQIAEEHPEAVLASLAVR
jgi:putative transcriptional regulator